MYHGGAIGASPIAAILQTQQPLAFVLRCRASTMNKKSLPLVIVNPAAGGGRGAQDWGRAVATGRTHLGPFNCTFTDGPGDATGIAEREARAGRTFLIAFGGDGTISEIAQGILRAEADTELGVLPHGTGSDFVRTLEIPSRPSDAARCLREGRTLWMDAGKVSYAGLDGETQSRFFINSASFGLSGKVTENTNRSSKSLGGMLSFASTTVKTAFEYDPPHVFIEVDDEPARRLPITTVTFNNGRFFGGGMKMAPEAHLADGKLDMVVVRKLPFHRLVTQGPRLYAGAHLGLPEVHYRQARSIKAWPVDSKVRVSIEVDGESPGALPASFEVCPKALRVRVPAKN